MKSSAHESSNHQANVLSPREEKKKTNIVWNSRLFFQIGLIMGLLATFFIMEMDFEIKKHTYTAKEGITIEEPSMVQYTLEKPKPVPIKEKQEIKPQPRKKEVVLSEVIKVDPTNSVETVDTDVAPTDQPLVAIEVPVIKTPVVPKASEKPGSILGVEFAPVFPGCESAATNQEKIACMSSKVSAFISKKFDTEKFSGLDSGTKNITVQFTIDASGYVTDVKARADNALLQKEATRVVEKLPKMRPGRQGITNVPVLYSIPILFRVE